MDHIGTINNREIFYLSVRENPKWLNLLPTEKWVSFTIVDRKDLEMLPEATVGILGKNVTYTCSVGELASLTEDYFDEEIAWRSVQYEERTGKAYDYSLSPMTTMHRNFEEGFWFASTLAYDGNKEINKIVCIDFTKRKVSAHLAELVGKINKGWLPSDEETKSTKYDK